MVPTYRVCRTSRCDVIKRRAPVYGYGSKPQGKRKQAESRLN
jgi:hypothetical protein